MEVNKMDKIEREYSAPDWVAELSKDFAERMHSLRTKRLYKLQLGGPEDILLMAERKDCPFLDDFISSYRYGVAMRFSESGIYLYDVSDGYITSKHPLCETKSVFFCSPFALRRDSDGVLTTDIDPARQSGQEPKPLFTDGTVISNLISGDKKNIIDLLRSYIPELHYNAEFGVPLEVNPTGLQKLLGLGEQVERIFLNEESIDEKRRGELKDGIPRIRVQLPR